MFMGQLRSELVCHSCGHTNCTFDPMRSVTLPLPQKKRRQEVLFVPHDRSNSSIIEGDGEGPDNLQAVQYAVCVPLVGAVSELLNAVGELCGRSPACLRACEIYKGRFQRLYEPRSRLEDIKKNDEIYVFEVPANMIAVPIVQLRRVVCDLTACTHCGKAPTTTDTATSDAIAAADGDVNGGRGGGDKAHHITHLSRCTRCFGAAYCGTACQKEHWSTHRSSCKPVKLSSFGRPFMLCLPGLTPTTYGAALVAAKRTAAKVMEVSTEEDAAKDSCILVEASKFGIPVKSSLLRHAKPRQTHQWSAFECVALEWRVSSIDAVVARELPVQEDASMSTLKVSDSTPTLRQAFELFSRPETLAGDDAWYCSKCKKHQPATQTLSVWSLPEYLVVHLKRFSWKNVLWRTKLDFLVDYPLEGLELGDFEGQSRGSHSGASGNGGGGGGNGCYGNAVYDLLATVDHFGSIWGGHYVCTARHEADGDSWMCYDDSHVTRVPKDRVQSKAAYVLVYRRRRDAADTNVIDGVSVSAADATANKV
eukprot:UC1_evm1s1943